MTRLDNPSNLDQASRIWFWSAVAECLEKFHKVDAESASRKIAKFRSTIEADGGGSDGADDMIYHLEPFYLACDLAGVHEVRDHEKILRRCSKEYRAIQQSSL